MNNQTPQQIANDIQRKWAMGFIRPEDGTYRQAVEAAIRAERERAEEFESEAEQWKASTMFAHNDREKQKERAEKAEAKLKIARETLEYLRGDRTVASYPSACSICLNSSLSSLHEYECPISKALKSIRDEKP